MNQEKIQQLENLLYEMRAHLGKSFCIVTGTLHDSFSLATYKQGGDIDKSVIAGTVSGCLEKICPT